MAKRKEEARSSEIETYDYKGVEFEIRTDPMRPLLSGRSWAARVTRSDPPINPRFAECYGETAKEAEDKAHQKMRARIDEWDAKRKRS